MPWKALVLSVLGWYQRWLLSYCVCVCSLENLPSPTSHLYSIKIPLYLLGTNDFLLSYQPSGGTPHIICRCLQPLPGPSESESKDTSCQLSHIHGPFLDHGRHWCILGPKNFWQHKPITNQLHLLCSIIRAASPSSPHTFIFWRKLLGRRLWAVPCSWDACAFSGGHSLVSKHKIKVEYPPPRWTHKLLIMWGRAGLTHGWLFSPDPHP